MDMTVKNMTLFNEIKEIAKCCEKIRKLIEKLDEDGLCDYGIERQTARLVNLSQDVVKCVNSMEELN